MPDQTTETNATPDLEQREPDHRPTEEQIAALAHALWVERGSPDGTPEEDWFRAEAKLSNIAG